MPTTLPKLSTRYRLMLEVAFLLSLVFGVVLPRLGFPPQLLSKLLTDQYLRDQIVARGTIYPAAWRSAAQSRLDQIHPTPAPLQNFWTGDYNADTKAKFAQNQKVRLIIGVKLEGDAELYWGEMRKDADAMARNRQQNQDYYAALEKRAEAQAELTMNQVIQSLPPDSYSNYEQFHFIPYFVIDVNETGLAALRQNSLVTGIEEDRVFTIN